MFRAKILHKLFDKSETPYFLPGEAEEIIDDRYNTKEIKEYHDNFGFYPYEIWNVDYTFLCFMYTHLKASQRCFYMNERIKLFKDEINSLINDIESFITKEYDLSNEDDNKTFKDICKRFADIVPELWS